MATKSEQLDELLRGRYFDLFASEAGGELHRVNHEGDNISCCCPIHDDANASFSFNQQNGKWRCYAGCGEGNYLQYVAQMRGISTSEAFKQLLHENGLDRDEEQPEQQPEGKDYTLAQYAKERGFTEEWLTSVFAMRTQKDKSKTQYLRIPYYDSQGRETVCRKRYAHKKFAWIKPQGAKIGFYGEWWIYQLTDTVILVEGESDTHTLKYIGIPWVLGVPGASMMTKTMAEQIKHLKRIFLHDEGDTGAKTFLAKCRQELNDVGYQGEILTFSCNTYESCKDPADVYKKWGAEEAKGRIVTLLKNAKNIAEQTEELVELVGAPMKVREPHGYKIDMRGVWKLPADPEKPIKLITPTPVIVTAMISNLSDPDTDKIEITALTNKGWKQGIFTRSAIYGTTQSAEVINFGVSVTAKSMSNLNEYFLSFIEANRNIIKNKDCTNHYGWQRGGYFIPGYDNGIIRDMPNSEMSAITSAGNYEEWRRVIGLLRDENYKFRFFLSVAFATPLLEILNLRTFVVYNWGKTQGGKTAALKAIGSVWGNPNLMAMTFNATQVGLEMASALYSDLPLLVDERQTAGKDEKTQNRLESTIYQICTGRSKQKGTRSQGLAELKNWSTIAFMTGEQPMLEATTQNGIRTRILQIEEGAFYGEDAKSLLIYDLIDRHYGLAGPRYIHRLKDVPPETLREAFRVIRDLVKLYLNPSTQTYESYFSVLVLGDALAESWLFSDKPSGTLLTEDARRKALWMLDKVILGQKSEEVENIYVSATQILLDWIAENPANFPRRVPPVDENGRSQPAVYGYINEDQGKVYILGKPFREMMIKAQLSQNQFKKFWADNGVLQATALSSGSACYSQMVKPLYNLDFGRYMVFDLNKAQEIVNKDRMV